MVSALGVLTFGAGRFLVAGGHPGPFEMFNSIADFYLLGASGTPPPVFVITKKVSRPCPVSPGSARSPQLRTTDLNNIIGVARIFSKSAVCLCMVSFAIQKFLIL